LIYWFASGNISEHMNPKLNPDEMAEKLDSRPGLEIPEETWTRIEHPANKKWSVAFRIILQGTQPVIGEVRIFPTESDKVPPGGITARLIKATKIESAEQVIGKLANRFQRMREKNYAYTGNVQTVLSVNSPTEGPSVPRKRRRRGKSDASYAALARQYVQLRNGGERHPVTAIAKKRRIERSKIRDMIHEARKRGLLSFDQAGRSGGQLTQLAINLLNQPIKRRN